MTVSMGSFSQLFHASPASYGSSKKAPRLHIFSFRKQSSLELFGFVGKQPGLPKQQCEEKLFVKKKKKIPGFWAFTCNFWGNHSCFGGDHVSCGVGGPEPGIPAFTSNFLVPDVIGDSGFSDHILRYQDYPGLRSDPWHQSEDHKSAACKTSSLLQHQTQMLFEGVARPEQILSL